MTRYWTAPSSSYKSASSSKAAAIWAFVTLVTGTSLRGARTPRGSLREARDVRTILCEATYPERSRKPMADISAVTDNNFHAEVIEADTPVLVDFWAPWCGPCRVVAPVLEEIASERDDLRVVKLNVDDNQRTAARYQVMAIPTMLLFRNGQ